jgi:hypothetical protein
MGSRRASNIENHLRRLREFTREQTARPSNIPNGRAQKRSVNRGLYGPRSGTSTYRAHSVASKTLTSRTMSDEEREAMTANATRNQSRDEQMQRLVTNNYPIPTEKGIYLK